MPSLAIACSLGCARQAPPAARAHAETAVEPAARGDDWSALSWEDRHDQMTFVVLPNMARAFQEYQHKLDPDLTCRSCHGADAEQVAYRMPNGLPSLDPAHMPDEHSPIVTFMRETVTPQMIDFLGVAPFDTKTGQGFGCFSCHPRLGT